MGPPTWLWKWAKPLAGMSTWTPLWGATWSANIWALVGEIPIPFLHHNLVSCGQALQNPSAIPMRWDLSGPPGRWLTMLRSLRSTLGSLFSTGETTVPEVPSRCVTLLACWGWVMQSECSHSFYPSNAVLLGLRGAWGGGASASPLCSGIFTMVSCLWVLASWSCEGDWR